MNTLMGLINFENILLKSFIFLKENPHTALHYKLLIEDDLMFKRVTEYDEAYKRRFEIYKKSKDSCECILMLYVSFTFKIIPTPPERKMYNGQYDYINVEIYCDNRQDTIIAKK